MRQRYIYYPLGLYYHLEVQSPSFTPFKELIKYHLNVSLGLGPVIETP